MYIKEIKIALLLLFCSCGNDAVQVHEKPERKADNSKDLNDLKSNIQSPDSMEQNFSDDCLLILTSLDFIKEEEKLQELIVVEEYINWDVKADIDFNIDGYQLPKSIEERHKRLNAETSFDPYQFIYIYANLIADSIFNNKDRKYIREQALKSKSAIDCTIDNVRLVGKLSKEKKKIGFFPPLYSVDHQYAVVRVFMSFRAFEDFNTGVLQTMYYKRGVRGWERVFASPKHILG